MHICSLLLTLSFILLLPVNESIIRSFLCRLQVRVPHCMSGQSGTGLPSSSVARQPGPAQQQQHAAPCEYTKHSDWDFSLLFSSQLSLIQLTRISLCVTVVQLSTNMYYSVVLKKKKKDYLVLCDGEIVFKGNHTLQWPPLCAVWWLEISVLLLASNSS